VKQSEARAIGAAMRAVAEVIGQDIIELEKRCAALEAELAELKGRDIDRRLRAVPKPAALIP